jgi:lysophospholipase L1-like esterase
MTIWPRKPLLVLVTLSILLASPYYLPPLKEWSLFEWNTVPLMWDFQPRGEAASLPDPQAQLNLVQAPGHATVRLQDPASSLDPFFESLRRAEARQNGTLVRILHYGDSPTTADLITADVRQLLQKRFGDAGHGLHLIAKPWAWYQHRGFAVFSEGWEIAPATRRGLKDGRYGVGGVSFSGSVGAISRLDARQTGHTRLRLSYLAMPGGGTVEVWAGDVRAGTLSTDAEAPMPRWQSFPVPASASRFELRVTGGQVRLFCYSLEKDSPGVIYDSVGLNGSWAGVLASYINEEHWAAELRVLDPDLVIVNYGTNESGFPQYLETAYPKDLRRIVDRLHRALPGVPLLLMTPMDRGQRQTGGAIGTIPGIPRVVATQARLAAETKVAFFNTFEAMGGPGTMGKWYESEPRLVSADFIHPMPNGARIVGNLFFNALMDGYAQYKIRYIRRMASAAGGRR